jgi:hypothetical protein
MDVKVYDDEIKLLASDVLILAIDGKIPAKQVMGDLRVEVEKRMDTLERGWYQSTEGK